MASASMTTAALAVGLLASCKTPPPSEPAPTKWGPIPGLMWMTEVQPWRLPHAPTCVAVGGEIALVGSGGGWLTWVDLRSGSIVRDRRVGTATTTFTDVVRLGFGRWLVVGTDGPPQHETTIAYAIEDDATFAAMPVPLGVTDDPALVPPKIAVVSNTAVAITGRGLPLAIYDSKSWTAQMVLDPALGWGRVAVRGTVLVAERRSRAHRFDLTSRARAEIPATTSHVAIGDSLVATRTIAGDRGYAELHSTGKAPVRLPDPIDAVAIDGTGTLLVTAMPGQLRTHGLSGKIEKRIELGDRAVVSRIQVEGSRAFVFTGGALRVVDLDAGTVTPIGGPPHRVKALAVTGDGTVLAFGDAIWRVTSGRVIATEVLGDARVRATRTDDIRHYATMRGDAKAVELRAFGSTRTQRWVLPAKAERQWIAAGGGGMVFDVAMDDFGGLVRTRGNELVRIRHRNAESELLDVDPDGDALIALDGRVAVADTRTGKPRKVALRVPRCEKTFPFGVVEAGGIRAATYSAGDVAVWDRMTGRLLGSASFDTNPQTVLFVRKTEELILVFDDRIVLWTLGGFTRTLSITGVTIAAMSADARGLALAFHDGRVAFVEVAALRDALTSGPKLRAAKIPAECSTRDPLADDPPEPEPKPEPKPEPIPQPNPEEPK